MGESIQELEKKLADAKKAEQTGKLEAWQDKVKGIIGNCYKVSSGAGYTDRVNTNFIQYIKVLGFRKIEKEGTADILVKSYRIAISPVGWTRKEGGAIAYRNIQNNFHTYRKRDIVHSQEIQSGKVYGDDYLTVVQIKDNIVCTGYGGSISNWWKPCNEREMLEVEAKCGKLSRDFYNAMVQYVDSEVRVFTEDSEGMMPELDEIALKRLDTLVTSGVDLKTLVNTLSGKVTKYNYFNSQGILGELAQYNQHGEKGLSLDIQGGNGGTDYEPYTTHYYIAGVSIDWAHILYPIRLRLNCKVFDLVAKLEKIEGVYNTSNWDCNFDTGSYDATFHSAKLQAGVLDVVNELIQENLKN